MAVILKTIFSALLLTMSSAACAAAQEKDVEAVIATDQAWLESEINGDVQRISDLLLPEYVTVDSNGAVKTRDHLIAAARRRAGPSEGLRKQVRDWKASHPTVPNVTITGDVAILKWTAIKPDGGELVSSVDIFRYDRGAWRAIYSQHSSASN